MNQVFKKISEKRRSINFFDTNRDVPEETLVEMVDLAANTPSVSICNPEIFGIAPRQMEKIVPRNRGFILSRYKN